MTNTPDLSNFPHKKSYREIISWGLLLIGIFIVALTIFSDKFDYLLFLLLVILIIHPFISEKQRDGRKIKVKAINKIVKNKTNKEEILKLLGYPYQSYVTKNGETIFEYGYGEIGKTLLSKIFIIEFFYKRHYFIYQFLKIRLNPKGVVIDYDLQEDKFRGAIKDMEKKFNEFKERAFSEQQKAISDFKERGEYFDRKQIFKKGKVHTITELENFPFNSFVELLQAVVSKKITIGIDQTVAREWMAKGKHSPKFWRFVSLLLHFVPHIVFLATIIIPILIGKPILILVVIPLFLTFSFLVPSSPLRGLVNIACYILLIVFIASLLLGNIILAFIVVPFLTIWIMSKILYNLSVSQMRNRALKDEELFCLLYKSRAINILFNETGDVLIAEYPKGEI